MDNIMKPRNRRILVITYDFYPDSSPNTYRWLNIIRNWKERGIEVYVLSSVKNQLRKYEIVDDIPIYRTGEFFIGRLKYRFKVRGSDASPLETKKESGLLDTFKIILRKIYDSTWSKFYWPDFAFMWRFSALPIARRIIIDNQIDKVVSVSWPFTGHLIGHSLKQEFESIFWLADTIDPFSFSKDVNNQNIYSRLNKNVEKQIFLSADILTVLTDKIRIKYSSLFPEASSKIKVNHNIFVPGNFNFEKSLPNQKIKMVFVGTLNEQVRSPANLLRFYALLNKDVSNSEFELHFYGDVTQSINVFEKYKHILDKSVFLHGKKHKSEINGILKEADILINIGNNNIYQEPSKLIEYMFTGKKIINICSITNDSSSELLRNYPLSVNILPEELFSNNLIPEILQFIRKDEKIDKEYLDQLLKSYCLETVAENYFQYIWGNNDLEER